MKIPELRSPQVDIIERLDSMDQKLAEQNIQIQAQKALTIAIVGVGGDKAEEGCVVVRDEVYEQSKEAAAHIDEILASIHRPRRGTH